MTTWKTANHRRRLVAKRRQQARRRPLLRLERELLQLPLAAAAFSKSMRGLSETFARTAIIFESLPCEAFAIRPTAPLHKS